MKKKMSTLEQAKVMLKLDKILKELKDNPLKQELLLKVLIKYGFEDLAELLDELKDYYI
jgi:hypothetical protein